MDFTERFEFWDLIGKIETDGIDREIIKFIGQGEKIPYISMMLGISEKTVDRRLKKMRKQVSLFP